ncbi:MAG: ATP synthase F1 subunit gamma [Tepidisphaeraceae bacterium]
MAKARAIVKRRKAVRNIRKITKTMQMIATAKFQKSLKRAVGTKPYTMKLRELVRELGVSVGDIEHPLLRQVTPETATNRIVLVVLTSNRGLAGAYNGSVLRKANAFLKEQVAAGKTVELYVAGKKGITFLNFQKRPIARRLELQDPPRFADAERVANELMDRFAAGEIDGVHVAYMNFISTGVQRAEVAKFLPLKSITEVTDQIARQVAEKEAQAQAGALDAKRSGADATIAAHVYDTQTIYDFSPDPKQIFDELLPLAFRTAYFQTYLDAATSEHVARMVAMKSATDAADKMAKALSMQYNRARQSQITTELSEIMGGVEAMKG